MARHLRIRRVVPGVLPEALKVPSEVENVIVIVFIFIVPSGANSTVATSLFLCICGFIATSDYALAAVLTTLFKALFLLLLV